MLAAFGIGCQSWGTKYYVYTCITETFQVATIGLALVEQHLEEH